MKTLYLTATNRRDKHQFIPIL
ncbi:hypothetical protein CY0110_17292 [Crocosphaera chwakensis CCY0110]|uniref:Uncharacterized protein n=1 Tax=Crocosphaera chwakensis CCY0110 TaxID=391612 RepID=A3IIE0_9CHRO|nr:hypothetical protein CY0110_17292 [Crocosphaera chwakensis CCY0110]